MAKISSKRRHFKIKQRQKRRKKLAKLREIYLKAKFTQEKEKILAKVQKISPLLSKEEFLKQTKSV